jgi:hypothetical protein
MKERTHYCSAAEDRIKIYFFFLVAFFFLGAAFFFLGAVCSNIDMTAK